MINKVSVFSNISYKQSSPSFGFAKLNELGRESADSFEMQENTFLDPSMFKKASFFASGPAILGKLKNGENFTDICRDYGCSKNAKTNAEFIKTQIINRGANYYFHKYVEEEELSDALLSLYEYNYDNPELSTKDTRKLLELSRYSMESSEYIQNVGLLQVGTKK